MSGAFAVVDDIVARFRPLDEDGELERASVLLDDACNKLAAEFKRHGKQIDQTDELLMTTLKRVACNMVIRILSRESLADIKQTSLTVGSYSQQFTYTNGSGDMWITADERRDLGIPKRKSTIGYIAPNVGGSHEG